MGVVMAKFYFGDLWVGKTVAICQGTLRIWLNGYVLVRADAVPDLGRWPRQMAFAQRLCICLAMTKRFIWLASIWCFFAACGFGQMAMTMRLLVLANISILANAVTKVLLLPTYPSSRD